MTGEKEPPIRPGAFVRKHIIPEGMTVTKAANLLGVGRPALSNFLNGKAALSPEMALRFKSVFRADPERLLDLQARVDRSEAAEGRPVVTGENAPALAPIKADDIDRWADRISSRQELAALLRRLIHSTGRDLVDIDFPAYDNAERPGWDGVVEAKSPTPKVPDGKSGWEFGCGRRPRRKANGDYNDRVGSVLQEERQERSFIFVTPRNWRKKANWVAEKAKLGDWRDVRAYDANDLEQWLEQSASTQVWFSEQLGMPVVGFRSLEQCWSDWAHVCDPKLSAALFDPATKEVRKFKQWLDKPPTRPFVIGADSREEALAFLCCLVGKVEFHEDEWKAGAVVFDSPEAVQRFNAIGAAPRIAVVHDTKVESQIGRLFRRCHCVILRPRNDVNASPDIQLDLLGWEDFSTGLKAMGLPEDRIERLARESARSPTVLRRRLSVIPAIREPAWARDKDIARQLLPAAMVGAWHSASPADREVMKVLAKTDDENSIDHNIAALLAHEDAPVWRVGEFRGVVSRIDALFGMSRFVTKTDLEHFFCMAENVLSEVDPALELSEDEQWMAPVYGRVRVHSDALRRGIRETLILLSVFGSDLFGHDLGIDIAASVNNLIHKLLDPLDRERILSHNADLPDFAEAAPEKFLSLIDIDLRQPDPVMRELMRPGGGAFGGSPLRIHLLWALEKLAWEPQRFPCVVEVLARLCKVSESEADDNWIQKPANTLASLFRSQSPQTVVPLSERIRCFEKLCSDYPELGWALCIGHLNEGPGIVLRNSRPRWRDDTKTTGRETANTEYDVFRRKALELALDWRHHNEKTLTELIQQIEIFPEDAQSRVWDLINAWAESNPSQDAKAFLHQRIQGCALVRRRRKRTIFQPEREQEALEKLLPTDLVARHAWLLSSGWIELPPEDSESAEFDPNRNRQRIRERGLEALREIWSVHGFGGIQALLERRPTSWHTVGDLMAEILTQSDDAVDFGFSCLQAAVGEDISRYRSCLSAFLWKAEAGFIDMLVGRIEARRNDSDLLLTLLLSLPYGTDTWNRVDNAPKVTREAYWKNVDHRVWTGLLGEEEINRSIDELVTVGRMSRAFSTICRMWDKVETSRLKRLLNELIAVDVKEYLKEDITGYDISEAFDELDRRADVPAEEKARLEFSFLPMLDGSRHGIPNLEAQIAASPELYGQAIACVFERMDGGKDPPGFLSKDPEQREGIAINANCLLVRVRHIAGTDADGNIDTDTLKAWLRQVREYCALHGRADAGDRIIGGLLARADQTDDNGIWPCQAICEVLEWMASRPIGDNFVIGAQNRRGIHSKRPDEGGNQERELAARYRNWARVRVHKYPYVSDLLNRIAACYERDAGREDNRSQVRQRLQCW